MEKSEVEGVQGGQGDGGEIVQEAEFSLAANFLRLNGGEILLRHQVRWI